MDAQHNIIQNPGALSTHKGKDGISGPALPFPRPLPWVLSKCLNAQERASWGSGLCFTL